MPEHRVGNLQHAVDFGYFGLLEVELFDHVMPLALILDRVGEAPLAPGSDLLHLATVGLDQLANLLDLLLDRLIIKLRLDDVHQLVSRQSITSFPMGFAPVIASRRQRSRKADISLPKVGRTQKRAAARRRPLAEGNRTLFLDLARLN